MTLVQMCYTCIRITIVKLSYHQSLELVLAEAKNSLVVYYDETILIEAAW